MLDQNERTFPKVLRVFADEGHNVLNQFSQPVLS
jgi:hypothetical protein